MSEATLLPDQARSYGAGYAACYDDVFAPGPDTELAVASIHALLEQLPAPAERTAPTVVELGVGTGRIAIPLAERGIDVIGIDSSPELLSIAAGKRADAANPHLRRADIRQPQDLTQIDLVLCLCATLSMILTREEQLATVRNAAAMLRPGGMLVIETHDPGHVRTLHESGIHRAHLDAGGTTIEFISRVLPGGEHWELTTVIDGSPARDAVTEISRLITPADLRSMAAEAGLGHRFTWSSWAGDPYTGSAPMYVAGFVPEPARSSD